MECGKEITGSVNNLQTESEGPAHKVTTAGLGILGRRMCISQQWQKSELVPFQRLMFK